MAHRSRLTSEEIARAPSALHAERRHVRFQDIDAAGIIFFSRVPEYFHDALVAFLRGTPADLSSVLRVRPWGTPVAHVEVDYLLPLRFDNEVIVELVRAARGSTSVTLGYRLRSEDGRVFAVGQMVHVCIDQNFRPRSVPDELWALLSPAEAPAEAAG